MLVLLEYWRYLVNYELNLTGIELLASNLATSGLTPFEGAVQRHRR